VALERCRPLCHILLAWAILVEIFFAMPIFNGFDVHPSPRLDRRPGGIVIDDQDWLVVVWWVSQLPGLH
jgi:hypothetical protein